MADHASVPARAVHRLTGHSSSNVWDDLLACIAAGRLDLKPLVSHVMPLEDSARAFQLLDTPTEPARKVVLVMV